MDNHEVEIDTAGWNNRTRLTCHTHEVTLIRQPYMSRLGWIDRVRQFTENHPAVESLRYYQALIRTDE